MSKFLATVCAIALMYGETASSSITDCKKEMARLGYESTAHQVLSSDWQGVSVNPAAIDGLAKAGIEVFLKVGTRNVVRVKTENWNREILLEGPLIGLRYTLLTRHGGGPPDHVLALFSQIGEGKPQIKIFTVEKDDLVPDAL